MDSRSGEPMEAPDRMDVLAVGANPDDVEHGGVGTLANLPRGGRRVGILHLTCGQVGTRGTVPERRVEAEHAAQTLGARSVEFLDFGDGALRTGLPEEEALIAVLRRLRAELVLGPGPSDRHPDHGRAHRLLHAACFYAGLSRRGEGEPHRPAAVFSYMHHDPFEPHFVVDVSTTWEAKIQALNAYQSQLHQPGSSREEPATKVASPEFRRAIEGRARHFGLMIGAAYGEPFWSPLPLAVADPWSLLPRGIR
ncbi:MAG: bacillithiol biosynthesis deacetylase BshB1 [Thermoanaerobaculia bacterium]